MLRGDGPAPRTVEVSAVMAGLEPTGANFEPTSRAAFPLSCVRLSHDCPVESLALRRARSAKAACMPIPLPAGPHLMRRMLRRCSRAERAGAKSIQPPLLAQRQLS